MIPVFSTIVSEGSKKRYIFSHRNIYSFWVVTIFRSISVFHREGMMLQLISVDIHKAVLNHIVLSVLAHHFVNSFLIQAFYKIAIKIPALGEDVRKKKSPELPGMGSIVRSG